MKKHSHLVSIRLYLVFLALLCAKHGIAALDVTKYIPIDEVRADMDAYCLTVFSGMEIERFGLKVVSVVRGVKPGQDMIVVMGTDERFQHAGVVHGCSGSPVFIDGRLAGALAAGWDGSLDSLYMVRPIEDMLQAGSIETVGNRQPKPAFRFDFSQPLNLADIYQESMDQLQTMQSEQGPLIPLSSSLPVGAWESLRKPLRQMGFVPVNAPAGLPTAAEATELEPGGVLAIVLCGGDISLAATGTVTEIVGDQVYGFGHSFKGQGPTNLPIAAGIVHAVVASRNNSFKFSSPGPVLGTLQFDQSSAVRGTIGVTPKTIPLTIRVNRDNDPEDRTYNCYLAADRVYTPMILQMALNGAALLQGPLPPEHTVRYEARVSVKGQEPLVINNVSSGRSTAEVERNLYAIVTTLLNNPFEDLRIESIDVAVDIVSVDSTVDIWAVDVSRTRVRPGQTISAIVTLHSFRSEESTAVIEFTVPETAVPGRYTLQILGDREYQRFVTQMVPQRYQAFDVGTMMEAFGRVTRFRNDRLHVVMPVASSGVVLRQHELPQLPATKMLLMVDSKRLQPAEPYKAWSENEIQIDKIVSGTAEIEIIVER
ncbi:MAG: hypothetical protein H8E62_04070 [Planctomycetes bacterium]|nr:hypothetical protein [Planctomycetota bacterium]